MSKSRGKQVEEKLESLREAKLTLGGPKPADSKRCQCQKSVIGTLSQAGKTSTNSHLQTVLVDRSVPLHDEATHYCHLKTLNVTIADVPSQEQPGVSLGSVSFGETFLESTLKVQLPDGSHVLDTDCVVLTAKVPRSICWPASPPDASILRRVENMVDQGKLEEYGKILLQHAESHMLVPDSFEPIRRGFATFYSEGLVYIHKHLGPILLPKSQLASIHFYDGDSPSVVGMVLFTLKPDSSGQVGHQLPPCLRSPTGQLALGLFPKTHTYKEFFSQVMSAWRDESQTPAMELVEELPECWQAQHSTLQQEYNAIAKPGPTPLKQAKAKIPHLNSFLDHFSASNCLRDEPLPAKDVPALLSQETDSGAFKDNTEIVLTLITGMPGSHQNHLCEALIKLSKEGSKWNVLQAPLNAESFLADQFVADLMTILQNPSAETAASNRKRRVLAVVPGYTCTTEVIQAVVGHPHLHGKVKIGAVTACIDPLNIYMEHSGWLPRFLDQCAQGWVNNIIFTGGVKPQSTALARVQSFLRAVNTNVAFLLADKGEVTRTPDVESILSETAFDESNLVSARHLSCPGWWLGQYQSGASVPVFGSVMLTLSVPLDKTRMLSKLKGLRAAHKSHPYAGNVYALKGKVAFADSPRLYELRYTVLSSYMSLVPTQDSMQTNGHQNGAATGHYCIVFTGCNLQEAALKAWLKECGQQVLEKKVLRTRKSLTKTELNKIHAEHHLEPLPEGWFYNGSQYVSLDGQKSPMHPNVEHFVEDYLGKLNQDVKKHNAVVESQRSVNMFEE